MSSAAEVCADFLPFERDGVANDVGIVDFVCVRDGRPIHQRLGAFGKGSFVIADMLPRCVGDSFADFLDDVGIFVVGVFGFVASKNIVRAFVHDFGYCFGVLREEKSQVRATKDR